jgi:hypothetical protein
MMDLDGGGDLWMDQSGIVRESIKETKPKSLDLALGLGPL